MPALCASYLQALQRCTSADWRVLSSATGRDYKAFLQKKWLIEDGYLGAISVEMASCGVSLHEEVDVDIDRASGTYSYQRPIRPRIRVVGPLSDIEICVFNVDAWLDDLAGVLEIERFHKSKSRSLVARRLWHLGDLRVRKSSKLAPVYVGIGVSGDWAAVQTELISPLRSSAGIVIVDRLDLLLEIPNGHHACTVQDILRQEGDAAVANTDALDRLLGYEKPLQYRGDVWFDPITGTLMLKHLAQPKTFVRKQLAVIKMFWRASQTIDPLLKWSDVRQQTECGKDPGSVFGPDWKLYLERVKAGSGEYRLRVD